MEANGIQFSYLAFCRAWKGIWDSVLRRFVECEREWDSVFRHFVEHGREYGIQFLGIL